MTRSALVGELLSHVRAGKTYGALLVGDTGFGKTRVLNALRTILAAEYEVIQLFPSRSLTPLPFGTVAAIIGHGEGSAITFHEALATIMGRIRETAHQGRRTLIVIDNASLVDQESSAVIAQAVLAGNCQVIMAQRNLSRETALTQLWRDGLLTRFQVGPLTQNEGFYLILSMTGGRLSHGAGNYLLRRAGGSPMALSGLVAGALEEGSLRCDDGWWVLDHPTGRYGGELTEIINADLAAMNPAERKIIELVALAGRVRLCDLNKLVNSAALDSLQESGQLKIDASGEPIVQMANRAHSGMIRQLVPIGRSQSYRHELAQVYDPWKTKDFKGKIRDVTWGLDCGILPSDQKLIIAARMANDELYSDDALRIATAAVDGPLRAAALAEQAQALVYHNDYLQAEQLGIAALEIATSAVDGLRALTATLHAQLPSKDGEEKLERVERLYFDRFPEAAESNSGIAQASRIVLAMAHLSLGHLDAARESFEKLLAAPADLSPVAEAMASVSLSEILSETGDVLAASGMARAALAAIGRQRHVSPHTAIYILTRSAVNFLNEGDFASARHLLHREEPENYSIELPIGGLKHLGIGIAFIHEGRLAEAAEELTAAAASLRGYDPWQMLGTALSHLAYSQAASGQHEAARSHLDELEQYHRRSGVVRELEAQAMSVAAESLLTSTFDASLQLQTLAKRSRELGLRSVELTIHELLIRLRHTESLPRFVELAESMEGRRASLFRTFASAVASKSGTNLEEAAVHAHERGYVLLAAELQSMAISAFDAAKRSERARRATQRLVAMRNEIPDVDSPWFTNTDMPKLTAREKQITDLVRAGHGNRDIADLLNVSLRTVEGHLYRLFIKLDVSSREELAEVAALLA